MAFVAIWTLMAGAIGLGYWLRWWETKREMDLREALVQKREQRINQWAYERLQAVDQPRRGR